MLILCSRENRSRIESMEETAWTVAPGSCNQPHARNEGVFIQNRIKCKVQERCVAALLLYDMYNTKHYWLLNQPISFQA